MHTSGQILLPLSCKRVLPVGPVGGWETLQAKSFIGQPPTLLWCTKIIGSGGLRAPPVRSFLGTPEVGEKNKFDINNGGRG